MHTIPALSNRTPTRILPRSVLQARLGIIHHAPVILSGLRATRLAGLPSAGALYLTPQGQVLSVHEAQDPNLAEVVTFTGAGPALWAAVDMVYPGVTPGSPALPRFWIVVEPSASGFPASLGILDLHEMRVVERGCARRELEERCDRANGCPESYLDEVEQAERAAAVDELLRELGGPRLASFGRDA